MVETSSLGSPVANARRASLISDVPPLPLDWAYLPLAALGLALVFAGLYQIYLLTQEKGPVRSAVAVVLFALFCGSVFLVFQ